MFNCGIYPLKQESLFSYWQAEHSEIQRIGEAGTASGRIEVDPVDIWSPCMEEYFGLALSILSGVFPV